MRKLNLHRAMIAVNDLVWEHIEAKRQRLGKTRSVVVHDLLIAAVEAEIAEEAEMKALRAPRRRARVATESGQMILDCSSP